MKPISDIDSKIRNVNLKTGTRIGNMKSKSNSNIGNVKSESESEIEKFIYDILSMTTFMHSWVEILYEGS